MSSHRSKRYTAAAKQVDATKSHSFDEAMELLKKLPAPKFDQSVTISMHMGVDPKKGEQMIRSTCSLPHGTGKKVTVLVFAQGAAAQAARDAGADYVGYEDLVQKVQGGFLDFVVGAYYWKTETDEVYRRDVVRCNGTLPNLPNGLTPCAAFLNDNGVVWPI